MMTIRTYNTGKLCLLLFVVLTACTGGTTAQGGDDKLEVVATTSIVGDVVLQVAGNHVDLTVLLPVETDPHTFVPQPKDLVTISEADIIFINGLGLEEGLSPILQEVEADRIVDVSVGLSALSFGKDSEIKERVEYTGSQTGLDPHVWMDPDNVRIWVTNILLALNGFDPAHAEQYSINANGYVLDLFALHTWITEQTQLIAPEDRLLVTDHDTFAYFADRYDFELVGAIIPSVSTNASPSAQELAALEDSIRSLDVPVIFVGTSVNALLAEQVARDTGVKLVFVYTGSLSVAGGGAEDYLDFMRYNVSAIVDALK